MLRTRVRAGWVAGVVLSCVFAMLATLVQVIDLYVPEWKPTLGAGSPWTLRVPYGPRITRSARQDGHLSYEQVRVIVPRNVPLREDDDDHRAAFAYESLRRPPRFAQIASLGVINLTLGLMLTSYLRRFGPNRTRLLRTQGGLLSLLVLALALDKALLVFSALPEFWVPAAAAAPLWAVVAFDRRTAVVVSVVSCFLCASLLRFDIVLLAVVLVRGLAASTAFLNRKQPRLMVPAGLFAGGAGATIYVALTVTFEGGFSLAAELGRPQSSNVIACVGGGLGAGLLALALREPVERLLGHVSRDRLFALADLEEPLLKKMAAEAPGSWEHSRAMANLAEAAASAIGADALLTRVGAYYHDLGKTAQAKYFVENLAPGERTPHADLEPHVSADAIMAHVVIGTRLLREGGVPEEVVEFAYTHHGTQLVEFFWHKCLEQGNPKNLTEKHFRYPGMKPQTKETAILMLIDSIEAAGRTIDPPDRDKFEEMIKRVVFTKLKAGQLDESGLTMED
ncbi:MAG TPA: HDIG domain-containing protein, partial [Polyangiaceae bacterium]|nr:HDIG domain-containing protein [Polyangiaceae bacterium]